MVVTPLWRGAFCLKLLVAGTKGKSAAAHQKCQHKNQTAGVDVEVEVSHLSAAAAKEENYQQHPCAVAASEAAALIAAAAAVAVVKHSVEHKHTSILSY